MKLEPGETLLPKLDRNKHHCQGHFLKQLRCHSTCVNGSTSNQESTTDSLLKFRRKSRILRHDRSAFRDEDVQNSGTDVCITIRVVTELVNSNMAEIFAKRRWSQEEISVLPGSSLCRDYSKTFEQFKAVLVKYQVESNIARKRVVTERLRRVHPRRWKVPRHALHHPITIDSRWNRYQERETEGVLHSSESYAHINAGSGITT